MLVELSVVEQRYHAVMEVISGAPVSEVARWYGVSRQSVHNCLVEYRTGGMATLGDHSDGPTCAGTAAMPGWPFRDARLGKWSVRPSAGPDTCLG